MIETATAPAAAPAPVSAHLVRDLERKILRDGLPVLAAFARDAFRPGRLPPRPLADRPTPVARRAAPPEGESQP